MAREAYTRWKQWEEASFGQFDRHEGRYYAWHVARALGGRVPIRVLEIGFGNGSFLGYGRARGWQMTGVELSTELLDRARRAGFDAANGVDQLAGAEPFDLIVLFDVLEHIEPSALIGFVNAVRARLAARGAILLRVPNGDSPFGRRHQHGDITHRIAIGEFMLRQIASACSLRVLAIGESPWNAQQREGRTLRAWWRARVRSVLGRVFGFAYFGGVIDLSPNLTAVLVPDAGSA